MRLVARKVAPDKSSERRHQKLHADKIDDRSKGLSDTQALVSTKGVMRLDSPNVKHPGGALD